MSSYEKIITVEHRGQKRYCRVDTTQGEQVIDIAKSKIRQQIDYELDEKPIREKKIAKYKEAEANYEIAKKAALDDLKFKFPPTLISLMEEFNILELAIENINLNESILSSVTPQIRALAPDIHHHRKNLDKNKLQKYWDSQDELKEGFNA